MSLYGWEGSPRIQFSIAATSVSGSIELVPFIFKIGGDTGYNNVDTTYVFDELSISGNSALNRKKVAFTQLVDSEEKMLYAELDFWNHVTKKAVFWVKPLELSENYVNIFYFYYNKDLNDNINYISEANQKATKLMIPLGSHSSADSYHNSPFDILKVNSIYRIWYLGGSSYKSSVFYCESTDLITFNNFSIISGSSSIITNYNFTSGSVIYKDGIYRIWSCANIVYSQPYGHRVYYAESSNGFVWTNFIECSSLNIASTDYGQGPCSVLFIEGKYKIWFEAADWGENTKKIYYAESIDGINWTGIISIFTSNNVPSILNTISSTDIYLSRVSYVDSKYVLWFKLSYLSGSDTFVCESINGTTNFSNFRKFCDFSLEGTYDVNGYSTIAFLEKPATALSPSTYIFLCGALDASNLDRIFVSESVLYYFPITPSQLVWEDLFSSVLHMNPSFGYVNSVNTGVGIASTNTVSLALDDLGGSAVNLSSSTSYANLGNNYRYNYNNMHQCIFRAKLNSGKYILNKGFYEYNAFSLYVQDIPQIFRNSYNDTFDGLDNSVPDPYLWEIVAGDPRIYSNNLKFSSGTRDILRTTYYVSDRLDIRMDFNVVSGTLTDSWFIGLRFPYMQSTLQDIIMSLSRNTDGNFMVEMALINSSTWMNSTWSYTWVRRHEFTDYSTGAFRVFYGDVSGAADWHFQYLRNGSWTEIATFAFALEMTKVELFKRDTADRDLTSFYITSFTTNFNTTYRYNTLAQGTNLALDTRYNGISNCFEYFNYALNTGWLTYAFGVSSDFTGLNALLGDTYNSFFYKNSLGQLINTKNVLLGNTTNSMTGLYSELLFTKVKLSHTAILLIDSSFCDNLLHISLNYVRGYTTLYNVPKSTKVLVYNQDNGDLIGVTTSDITTGFYSTEVPFVTNVFVVGIGDSLYNHFILNKVTLQWI